MDDIFSLDAIKKIAYRGKYNRAYILLHEYYEKFSASDPEYVKGILFEILVLRDLGKLEQSEERANYAYQLASNIEDKTLQIDAKLEFSYTKWKQGYDAEALEILNDQYEKIKNLDEKTRKLIPQIESKALHIYGLINIDKANLLDALSYYEQSLELKYSYGDGYEIGTTMNNIGVIYYNQGHMFKALEYYNSCLKHWSKLENPNLLAIVMGNIGLVHFEIGDLEQSEPYLEESVKLAKQTRNPVQISNFVFEYLHISLLSNKITEAKALYMELIDMKNQSNNLRVLLAYRLATALIKKYTGRLPQKIEGQLIFREIIKEEVINYRWTAIAIRQLFEYFLYEIELFGSEVALEDAIKLINKLQKVGQVQQSLSITLESLILKSKLQLLMGNLTTAQLILDQASITAMENSLTQLEERVNDEIKILESAMEKWIELIESNASLQDRLKETKLLDYLDEINKHNLTV